jgi:DNA ligase-1
MLRYPTLYKQDSKGKIRTYFIEQEGADYRMVTGLLDGKEIRTKWTTALPKNSGKANATTAEEQAKLEIEARYTKKLGEHYHEEIESAEVTQHSFFAPMLATTDKAAKFEMVDGEAIIVDPKLDGMRLSTDAKGFRSRKGKPVPAAQWIYSSLYLWLANHPTITLDGEIYNHAYKDDFQSLMKICRRTKLSLEDRKKAQNELEYHIYDFKDSANPNMTALERKQFLDASGLNSFTNIHVVEWELVDTIEGFKNAVDKNLLLGYEGSIVRIPDSIYQNKRSKDLIKIKEFDDTEFEVLDIIPGKGNRSDIAGSVIIKVDGQPVGCGIRGSWDFSKKLLEDVKEYIGGIATVRYFGLTDEGKPRFPVLIDINRPD